MRDTRRAQGWAGWLAAGLGAAVLAAGCSSKSSTGPSNTTLTANAATVQAALNTYTSGTVVVPANCLSAVAINCPAGVAGSPTSVTVARSGLSITQAAADSFAYAMDLGIATQQPITVSNSGIDCGVSINTAAGSSPTVHLVGTASFVSRTMGGPLDEVDLTTVLTGAEAADVTITGPANCQVLASSVIVLEATMIEALTNGTSRLCPSAGGHFAACS